MSCEMDKLKELKEYIEQMKIKKSLFGGYNKEDVQLKFDVVYAMFEKVVNEQEKKERVLIADFEKRLQELTEEKVLLEKEQVEMKTAYKTYCENMLDEYKGALRALSGEFSRILDDVSNIQKELEEDTIFTSLEDTFAKKGHDTIPVKEEIYEEYQE